MCRPDWPQIWQRRHKHRQATRRTWDTGEAKSRSATRTAASQYNPYEFGTDEAVRELELRCVNDGELIRASVIVRKYYLRTDTITGVCSGEVTQYVYAEWHCTCIVHGRPISEKELKKKGAQL